MSGKEVMTRQSWTVTQFEDYRSLGESRRRRKMSKKASLIVVSVMVLAMLLSACGPAPEPEVVVETVKETVIVEQTVKETVIVEQTVKETVVVEKEAPAAGGTCGHEIRIGINGDGQSVNPLYGSDSSTVFRTDQISEPLVFLDWQTGEPIPWLAESWDVSEDGTTYTFHLREGPQWPDGTPLTAQDFEFTLMTILSPDYTGPWQGYFAGLVGADKVIAGETDQFEGLKVIDDKTFQLTLSQPNAAFLVISARNLKPIPKHLLEGENLTTDHPFMQDPVGVGPYRVLERLVGDHTTLEAKDEYWGEPVCAERITEQIIPDMEALAAAIESGSVDEMNPLEPRYVLRFQENPDINVHKTPSRSLDALHINTKNEFLADPKVRQAIAMTVDMEQFSQTVLKGVQAPGKGPLSPSSWAYDPTATIPTQDIEKAKELLAEAGYADGFTVNVKTNAGNTTREQMATYLQAQLAEIGVTAEVEFQEWATFFTGVREGNFDIVVLSGGNGIPDPDTMYNDYHTDGASNWGKYSNAEVDELLEEARVTMDMGQRTELYKQVQQILVQELPRIWAYEYLMDTATLADITNVKPSFIGPMWDSGYWRKQ
jgi:peptide/nickel transport system substrate-binding protein